MADSNGNEKRRHPRVGFTTQIKIELHTSGKQIHLKGNSKDLSLKGVFVSTKTADEQLPEGTGCQVHVYLSGGIDEIKLSMEGTVVRSDHSGMGIEFDSMEVETYSHLKNIVYYNRVEDSDSC